MTAETMPFKTELKQLLHLIIHSLYSHKDIFRRELIGQFGVGFYSAFMVADRVTVLSRTAGRPEDGVKWESDGQGSFTLEAYTKPTRGTDVILHLKEEDKEYLQPWRLRQLVKK